MLSQRAGEFSDGCAWGQMYQECIHIKLMLSKAEFVAEISIFKMVFLHESAYLHAHTKTGEKRLRIYLMRMYGFINKPDNREKILFLHD